jgi:hypothetical protein
LAIAPFLNSGDHRSISCGYPTYSPGKPLGQRASRDERSNGKAAALKIAVAMGLTTAEAERMGIPSR